MEEYLIYEEQASRAELIVRIFYSIGIEIVQGLYGILAGVVYFIQWILILILGERSEILTNVLIGYTEYCVQTIAYRSLVTDKRPGLLPKELKVYLNLEEYLIFEKEASRVELIVRIFYSIPISIVLYLYAILYSICFDIQWIAVLITGKRFKELDGVLKGFAKYWIQVIAYLMLVTDERPEITPKDLDVSLEIFE
ncbi:DUF4389 domain-containing protein [Methanobrevibacter curvatus]|uniref:Uncharacterized protein n=1 Tax=Methanobrevibacter curvatus TaxID=49547 RepID=A0A165ZDB2_9EURY|nr:DUF4389 domain-containing protein [Methanobrevibacter curvatus]KZX10564.1 hypothetical protein MBCUR_17480 [Methanobrevibacter curvatus]